MEELILEYIDGAIISRSSVPKQPEIKYLFKKCEKYFDRFRKKKPQVKAKLEIKIEEYDLVNVLGRKK